MESVVMGDNQFCGPAVLSILTGKSTDECADIFMKVGQYGGKEVSVGTIKKALDYLEFESTQIQGDCSLYALMHQIVHKTGMYLVIVPKHVVALEVTEQRKILFCDNHTKNPMDAAHSARLGQRVSIVYHIVPRPIPKFGLEEMKQAILNSLEYGPKDWNRIYSSTGQRPKPLFEQAKQELLDSIQVMQLYWNNKDIENEMVFLAEHNPRLRGWKA